MRRKLLWLSLFISLPLLAGAKIIDRIAAIVNDEVITESEVIAKAYPYLLQIDADTPNAAENAAQKKEAIRLTLEELINEKLLSAAALELQIEVNSEEVDRAIDQILQRNGLTINDLELALKQQGSTLKKYREDIRDQLIRFKVIGNKVQAKVNVTDEEALTACEADRKSFGDKASTEVELQQMLFLLPEDASDAEKEAKTKKANEAAQRTKGGEDFAQVAAQLSDDPSIELGSIDVESLDPLLGEPLKKANKGDIVGPIKEKDLIRVFRVVDKRSTAGPTCQDRIEDYRAALQDKETNKVLQTYLQELRKKAYVDVKLK